MAKVFGLFADATDAERAINALRNEGFAEGDISVLAREQVIREYTDKSAKQRTVGEVTGIGAVSGGVVGGLGGLALGLLSLALPVVGGIGGALVAAGWTAAGAAVGAAGGGLIGLLIGQGISEEMANTYAEGIRRGGVLIGVDATTPEREEIAFSVMQEMNALDINERRSEWQRQGWRSFDESSFNEPSYPPL